MPASVYVCTDSPPPPLPGDCTAWTVDTYEPSPFALTSDEGGQIGVAIMLVWAVAWGIREIARLLRGLR